MKVRVAAIQADGGLAVLQPKAQEVAIQGDIMEKKMETIGIIGIK